MNAVGFLATHANGIPRVVVEKEKEKADGSNKAARNADGITLIVM